MKRALVWLAAALRRQRQSVPGTVSPQNCWALGLPRDLASAKQRTSQEDIQCQPRLSHTHVTLHTCKLVYTQVHTTTHIHMLKEGGKKERKEWILEWVWACLHNSINIRVLYDTQLVKMLPQGQCFYALIRKVVPLEDRWSGHEVRDYMNRIHTLRPLGNLLRCLLMRDHKKQPTAYEPVERPHQNPAMPAPLFRLQPPRLVGNSFPLLTRHPNYWSFIVAAWANGKIVSLAYFFLTTFKTNSTWDNDKASKPPEMPLHFCDG